MFATLFSSKPSNQTAPPAAEPEKGAALTIYQKQQSQSPWWAESLNYIIAQVTPSHTKTSIFSSSKKLDPKNFSNACKILGINEENATNLALVHTQYKTISNDLLQRQAQLSGPLASEVQLLITDIQTAYATLTQPQQEQQNEFDTFG
jgi:hypothetical protein